MEEWMKNNHIARLWAQNLLLTFSIYCTYLLDMHCFVNLTGIGLPAPYHLMKMVTITSHDAYHHPSLQLKKMPLQD